MWAPTGGGCLRAGEYRKHVPNRIAIEVSRSGDAARLDEAVSLRDDAFSQRRFEQGPNRGNATTKVSSMMKLWPTKRPAVLSLATLSFAFLVSSGFLTDAWALCNTHKCVSGMSACIDWCFDHNKTIKSQKSCYAKCDTYWVNGASKVGRPDPTNPTKGTIGPGRLKNPPTTVGPPTRKPRPVHPVKPVGVSNPNKTDSGNGGAILLRKNDSGGRQGHGH